MNLVTKRNRHTDMENKPMVTSEVRGWGGINWEFGINTIIYINKIDKQQGPTVQHRGLYSISYSNQ